MSIGEGKAAVMPIAYRREKAAAARRAEAILCRHERNHAAIVGVVNVAGRALKWPEIAP